MYHTKSHPWRLVPPSSPSHDDVFGRPGGRPRRGGQHDLLHSEKPSGPSGRAFLSVLLEDIRNLRATRRTFYTIQGGPGKQKSEGAALVSCPSGIFG